METDVLVIGGGGAGLYAATRAAQAGTKVVLWDKGLVGRSGATVGGAAIAAVGPWKKDEDSTETHFKDIVMGGSYLSTPSLARILAEEAPRRISELEKWGIQFDRYQDGSYVLDIAGGHSHGRLLAVSDRVGLQITKVLRTQLVQLGAKAMPDVMVTRLLMQDDAIVGAVGIDFGAGEILVITAPAVVLATGGIGQLYPITSNPVQGTGDGLAVALRAGAGLINMEQVQFYPSCMVFPSSMKGFGLGIQEYAELYNSHDERFMVRYEPERLEKTTRDRLARAIRTEVLEGRGSENGGIYLDATKVPKETFRSFQHEYETCMKHGIDMHRDRVEVGPAEHFFMGGVAIDDDGGASLKGLFAAGEVTGGVHGGNRLSGNSLADIVVFGARAGESAARWAKESNAVTVEEAQSHEEVSRLEGLLQLGQQEFTADQAKDQLRAIMWDKVGVLRDRLELEAADKALETLRVDLIPRVGVHGSSLRHNQSLESYVELEGMIWVAQLIVRSAKARPESRGAHYRKDYPELDESQRPYATIVKLSNDEIHISTKVIEQMEIQ